MLIYTIPIVTAFIGWLTNVIALRLIFWPYKPIFGIQGIIPKHHKELAEKLGRVAKKYMIDGKTMVESISPEEVKKVLLPTLAKIKDPTIIGILTPIIEPVAIMLKDYLAKNIDNMPELIKIDKVIADRFKKLNFSEIEQITYKAAGSGFNFIKITGAVLGFIIGCIQLVIILIS